MYLKIIIWVFNNIRFYFGFIIFNFLIFSFVFFSSLILIFLFIQGLVYLNFLPDINEQISTFSFFRFMYLVSLNKLNIPESQAIPFLRGFDFSDLFVFMNIFQSLEGIINEYIFFFTMIPKNLGNFYFETVLFLHSIFIQNLFTFDEITNIFHQKELQNFLFYYVKESEYFLLLHLSQLIENKNFLVSNDINNFLFFFETKELSKVENSFFIDKLQNNIDQELSKLDDLKIKLKTFYYALQFKLLLSIELFLGKKIFFFSLINYFFMIFISYILFFICKSTNLIYTLINFLLLALIIAFFIIFWGSEYLGLCTILIYGGAIPVLALYIIMLMNVDVMLGLFFYDGTQYLSSINLFIYCVLAVFSSFIFCFFLSTSNFLNFDFKITNLMFFSSNFFLPLTNDFTILFNKIGIPNYFELAFEHIFFLLIAKGILNINFFSAISISFFDLIQTYLLSDIDKVVVAAYKINFNELLALGFLLLIAIIIIITISGPKLSLDNLVIETIGDFGYFSAVNSLYLKISSLKFFLKYDNFIRMITKKNKNAFLINWDIYFFNYTKKLINLKKII